MIKVISKLKSNKGMSIILALCLFLLGTMVSVVIISAATTSAKTARGDRDMTQNYLLLESAARVFQSELKETKAFYREVTVTDVSVPETPVTGTPTVVVGAEGPLGDAVSTASGITDPDVEYAITKYNGPIGKLFRTLKSSDVSSTSISAIINLSSDDVSVLNGKKVNVVIEMYNANIVSPGSRDYKINALFTMDDCPEKIYMSATWSSPGSPDEYFDSDTDNKTETTVIHQVVTWSNFTFSTNGFTET